MRFSTTCSILFSLTLAAAQPAQAWQAPGQPVHKDKPFTQRYSIKYNITGSARPEKIACDRNGVIQIYTNEGLLRPYSGAFLYPGELRRDISYRPIRDKKIKSVGTFENQLVYVDDTAVLSNAWAGKLYSRHTMPSVKYFAVGKNFAALLSDGNALQFLQDSKILWNGTQNDPVIDIQYDAASGLYYVLGKKTLSAFSPGNTKLQVLYTGDNLTAFSIAKDHRSAYLGTHDGYILVDPATGAPKGDIQRRLPWTDISVIRDIDGQTWFGTTKGAFLKRHDGGFDYFSSLRWFPSDNILDISSAPDGTILVLTDKGLGEIHSKSMTLYDKAMYYEQQVRARHIRNGFNSSLERMKDGDFSTGSMTDSDNDGLWTSMYLGGEVFRYAATHSPEALQNIRESLDAMERLYTVNPLKGFPSRSFERRGYAAADTEVWKHAPDPEWDWKSTTSSDEAIGHAFVYGAIAELVDDTACKKKAIRLIDALMTHIVEHDMYMIDWNGKPTVWGKWNPEYVNARPIMVGDRKINSSNIVAMLQTAYHFTGKKMFKDKALELMNKYGYLENLMRPMASIAEAPATADDLSRRLSEGWNHSDDEMYFLGYWGLYRYALNDTLKSKFKASILDHWQIERPEKDGAWDLFTAVTGTTQFDLPEAVWYLQRFPLDMIDWTVEASHRKDIDHIPANFRNQTIKEVLPPDEIAVNRHNRNRFQLDDHGNGRSEFSAGDIWLLPYWLGRYLKVIGAPETTTAPKSK